MTNASGKLLTPRQRKTIPLSNGLELEAWDFTRHTAGDRCQVVLGCRIPVTLSRQYFPPDGQGQDIFDRLVAEAGPVLFYEYRDERNFIADSRRETVWEEMLDRFIRDSLAYLSHPRFAERFALAASRELLRDPFKFRTAHRKSLFRRLDQDQGSSPT